MLSLIWMLSIRSKQLVRGPFTLVPGVRRTESQDLLRG